MEKTTLLSGATRASFTVSSRVEDLDEMSATARESRQVRLAAACDVVFPT